MLPYEFQQYDDTSDAPDDPNNAYDGDKLPVKISSHDSLPLRSGPSWC